MLPAGNQTLLLTSNEVAPGVPPGQTAFYSEPGRSMIAPAGEVGNGTGPDRGASGAGGVGPRLGRAGRARRRRSGRRSRTPTAARRSTRARCGPRSPGRACSACTCRRARRPGLRPAGAGGRRWRSWAGPWCPAASCRRCWPAPSWPAPGPTPCRRAGHGHRQAALLTGLADGSLTGRRRPGGRADRDRRRRRLVIDGDCGPVLGGGLADVLILPAARGRWTEGGRGPLGRGGRRRPGDQRAGQPGPDPPGWPRSARTA